MMVNFVLQAIGLSVIFAAGLYTILKRMYV